MPKADSYCPNVVALPDIVDIYSLSGFGNPNQHYPVFDINNAGSTGVGMRPALFNRLSVSGATYINGHAQITQQLRVGNAGNLTPTDWYSFPYNFAVEKGNSLFLGQVQIGSTQPINGYSNYKLGVDGDIVCKRLIVQVKDWADYVFDPAYKLPSLTQLEAFVNCEHHLPNIPTTAEVEEKGISVGEMNTLLLKKVEELTLYLIQQQKEIEQLKSKVHM